MTVNNKIAILLFHPLLEKSRVNRKLTRAVEGMNGVSIRYMYDLYPDFHIDTRIEQQVLRDHDVIIWQHPLYWYSSPSLLKEWIDIVLEHGFAFGRDGNALKGKMVMQAISSGGSREVYKEGGLRNFSIRQLLAPFEQTANLCNMVYLPPHMVHGSFLLDEQGIEEAGSRYRRLITLLAEGAFDPSELKKAEYFNDILT